MLEVNVTLGGSLRRYEKDAWHKSDHICILDLETLKA